MNLNIDIIIFSGFLIINLAVGLFYGRGIKTIKEYAIGERNFSTATIAATILATWIGAGIFSMNVSGSYKDGLYYIVPALGNGLMFIIIGYFLSVRMGEFLGSLSIAEVMNNLYGKHVRLITSIMSIFFCIGTVAIQFKVSANILELFFDIHNFYAVIIAAAIIIFYSTWGGIKSVTFTDLIQIFMFGSIIPIISIIIWGTITEPSHVVDVLNQDPLYDFKEVFDYHNPRFLSCLLLFLVFLFPELDPAVFQRILIAKDTNQVSKSFIIAGIVCLGILLMLAWIGSLLRVSNPSLDTNNLLKYIIDNYAYTGLKGIVGAGIMAAIMSTADSYINSAAVIFSNDVCKAVGIKLAATKELLVSRFFSFSIGVLCLLLAFQKGILELMVLTWSFYMPIVSVPLILAIFGFRSSSKSVLIGMISGFTTVVIWRAYFLDIGESVIPGIIAHLVMLMGSHYLLKQPGGWIGIKEKRPLEIVRQDRKRKLQKLIKNIKEFNFFTFCKNNCPKEEYTYSFFGLFCIVSVFSTMYSIPKEVQLQYKEIIKLIYHTILVLSTILLSYPMWPSTFKKEKFIWVLWTLAVPYILVFAPTILVIISNFGQFQLMIFLVNMIIIALMLRWHVAIFMISFTIFLGVQFYKWDLGLRNINATMDMTIQFKIMYVLLLISSVLIALLKPQQQRQELTEEKNEHLNGRIISQEKQVKEALSLRSEFIRNVNHEYHAPMTGITSLAEVLVERYDRIPDEQRRKALEDILKSSRRLDAFDENLSTLSKLSKEGYKLNLEDINLSDLTYDRVETCRKLYEENKVDKEFVLNIQNDLVIKGDRYYLTQALDNLIINAITYCKKGKITISLEYDKNRIAFTISDEGIGIPPDELNDIFDEFVVSSKTRTPAGGRGVGLALCKRVIDVHGGKIKAESDGVKGATFKFSLSLVY